MKAGIDYIGVACFGLIINDKNEVLLLKRKDDKHYERPGGRLESKESFEECLKREIKEETDITVTVEDQLITELNVNNNQPAGWICIGCLCKYESGEAKVMEPDKHTEVKWFSLANLPPISRFTRNAIEKYSEKI